jgi:phosphoenolpyruvate synthase/pyruvate phosphate dikinase
MKWFNSLTRELPFFTLENWKYVYTKGWPKLLGFGLKKHSIYYSKRGIVEIYREKEEYDDFIKKLEKFCLEKPDLLMHYYDELERLDKKIQEFSKREVKNKEELKALIEEISEMFDYYATVYLIKTYSNYVLTEEVIEKQPELVKRAKSLVSRAMWFDMAKSLWKKASSILGLPEKTIKMLTLKEMLAYIDTGAVDSELAEKRFNGFLWDIKTDKWYYGKDADEFFKQLGIETTISQDIIKGVVANKGKATGKVVVALGTVDFHKITKGCILVAHMTAPWYTPYIPKVKAIVTDEGGIGTHAAVISREFGIPCIIGTKIATKVLKDGDMVEVDADNGIVRKIG